MREILFRGYDGYEWRYGELTNIQTVPQICIEPTGIIGPFSFTVDPKTIGQYTGQKSAKSEFISNIFEGDKVIMFMTGMGCEVPEGFEGVVIFTEGKWIVTNDEKQVVFELFQELGWWEITGNIHD